MAYLALYREWRPKTLQEIVGQDHVKVTLTNALSQNKIAHAYLFSGPRGTGKTTAAKILAKALNCTSRKETEPCNQCLSCQSIDTGTALDVLEIDAASNRGIDEIRDLREKVKFASSEGKYKIYIIDEVHMLTNEAFNALLKTLEEPPANVVFILATTEAHKVPLTILSRVQRFEFHRISVEDITTRLKQVCRTMGREVEDKALQVIASKAEGGLRDALSILDQCLLLEDPIKEQHIYQIIGMVGESFSADLFDCLLEQDYAKTLSQLEKGVSLGRDPRQIIKELLDYLRQALLYITGGVEPLLSPERAQRLKAQSKKAGLEKLILLINALLKGEGDFRYSSNARLTAEMILIQALFDQSQALAEDKAANKLALSSATRQSQTYHSKITKAVESQKPLTEQIGQTEQTKQTKQTKSLLTEDGDIISVVKAKWPQILDEVKKKKKSTHAFLLEGKPAAVKGDILYLTFKEGYSFHKEKFDQPENKQVVEIVLQRLLGCKLQLNSVMESDYQDMARDKPVENPSNQEDLCINKAVDFFGPELVQVKKDN
ncbi:MAG: DNA polymerase III subunit gamma/tau [Peptococcaceae bacterium]|nr:DNA polymerase III subunit gamma/tau [Peptococcaceae bacterium]